MNAICFDIPEDTPVVSGTPRPRLELELLRRLVAAMYADEVVGGSAPCMLAGPEKLEIQQWLGGQHRIPPVYFLDYALERPNLTEFLR